ncbi:Slp family lipoprotein [Oceanobacter antarcticus]|jgi:outer membrane lipoprotein|uniref:Slp family lipoprotein n=1 Tax=Oceanobacter antarcticus TaxID=3133425 RepID=A0ABW8NGT0_9GAMM
MHYFRNTDSNIDSNVHPTSGPVSGRIHTGLYADLYADIYVPIACFLHPANNSSHKRPRIRPGLIGLALLLSGLLSGCASYPKSISVANPDSLPDLQQLQASPDQYQHQTVVLGGRIVSVINGAEHTTLEILHRPLWSSGQPHADNDQSGGRFRAELGYFVDPEIYQPGRLVTVRGQFTGMENGQIGDHAYRFALIKADGIELWRETVPTEVHYYTGWGTWGGWPYYPPPSRRGATIIWTDPLKHDGEAPIPMKRPVKIKPLAN